MLNYLKDIDLYGKTPHLYYKGKSKKSSGIGIIFTIIYCIIYLGYFIYKLYRLIKREDIKFYDSFAYVTDTQTKFTKENFYIAFALYDSENNEPFMNEEYYYPDAYYIDENGETKIDVVKCSIDKFGSQHQNLFKDYPLDHYYCLSNVNHNFQSYINSYYIEILPCNNNKNNCKPANDIYKKFLQNNYYFITYIQEVSINPTYDNYLIKPKTTSVYNNVYLNVGQSFYIEMSKVKVEIDKNIIGFGSSKDIETKEYLKFDNAFIMPAPSFDVNDLEKPICDIEFQLSDKIILTKIKYRELFDVLAEIGGFMSFFYSFFYLVIFSIIDILYDETIVNDLFSFDKNKKVIFFNKKNNDLKIIIKNEQTYNNTKPEKVNSAENDLSNRNLNKDINENKKDDIKLFPYNIKKIDDSKINENVNNNIISKINLNKCCAYFSFCCARRTRNVNNVLLDEGINKFTEKLDILNLFNIITYNEKLKEKLNEELFFEMSQNCKDELSKI